MAALDAALGGKKGSYVESEGVYTTPLPRNDLRVTIKGVPVPISFGFGGWVSLKRTLDGQRAMLGELCRGSRCGAHCWRCRNARD
jgi:hypothetical protein